MKDNVLLTSHVWYISTMVCSSRYAEFPVYLLVVNVVMGSLSPERSAIKTLVMFARECERESATEYWWLGSDGVVYRRVDWRNSDGSVILPSQLSNSQLSFMGGDMVTHKLNVSRNFHFRPMTEAKFREVVASCNQTTWTGKPAWKFSGWKEVTP